MKKTVKLLVVLCMTLLLWEIVASADTYTDEKGNVFTYSINSPVIGAAAIKGFQGSGDVVIPDELDGYKVTVITAGAFKDCHKITSIKLNENLRNIWSEAFYGCSGLTEVVLPDSIDLLFDCVFSHCYELKKITLSKNLKSISSGTFTQCLKLEEIVLHEGITSVENHAFYQCESLKKIVLPQSLTSIEGGAFVGCEAIENIEYKGSSADWNKVTIETGNASLNAVPIRFLADECEHVFGEWSITKAPDCLNGGSHRKECELCGYYVVEDLLPLGHDTEGVEWVRVRNPGCYYYGLEELTCNRCGKVAQSRDITPTEEHIYDFDVIPPTCTEQGFTYYYCTEPYCGAYYYDDYTDIIDHSMSDWEWWDEPTCTRGVTKHRWCIACGLEETGEIPALGHDTEHAEWVIIQYAGCYNQGEEGLICERCHEPIERRPTPVRGHMYDEFYYEPTCTESGYIEYRCWECGYSYQVPYGEPAGHQMSDWEVVEEPNCLSTGLMVRRCWYWDCEYYEEEIIESTDHRWGDWGITFNPECEEDGIKIRICNYCGAEDEGRVPALGHSFGEWMPWEYDEFGEVITEMRMCGVCTKEEYRTPPMAFNFIRTNKDGDSINAYVTVRNMPNGSAIWFAAYGDDGRFLGIRFAEVKNSCASAEFTGDDIAKVKAFTWGDGVSPLCNYASADVTR